MKEDSFYLRHVLDAAGNIKEYIRDGKDAFLKDRKTQDAVIRNLEIIGEAVRQVSEETRARDATVPWKQISGMRDRLIHGYFGVDLELVWEAAEREVPNLQAKVAALLLRGSSEPAGGSA